MSITIDNKQICDNIFHDSSHISFNKQCMKKIYSYRAKDFKRWGIAGDISIKDIEEMLIRQNKRCYVCKEIVLLDSWTNNCLYQFSIDRINEHFPHDRDNFLISCYHCNCTFYTRDDSEKKICINGCHKDEKVFKSSRIEELPIMEHLRLSHNINRDVQLKIAYETIYEHKKTQFENSIKDFNKNKLKIVFDRYIIVHRLFRMFKDGINILYTSTNEFMNQLYDIRMCINKSTDTYLRMSNTLIRPFHEWYADLQTKIMFKDRCPIEISTNNILINRIDDIYETQYKSKLKKKIDRVFQTIYGQKDFEFNPINLMTLTGLNSYLLISYEFA